MSWDVSLECSECHRPVELDEAHTEGGTYCVGGTTAADLNVTYNYSTHFREHLHPDGLAWLDGKPASETIDALAAAVEALGTVRDKDYWAPTPGNAGYALSILLRWARMSPEAVFVVH